MVAIVKRESVCDYVIKYDIWYSCNNNTNNDSQKLHCFFLDFCLFTLQYHHKDSEEIF